MLFPINNAGQFGIVVDRQSSELPPNTWTNCRNVRFADGFAQKMFGQLSVFGTVPVPVHWAISLSTTSSYFWIEAGLQKVYVWDGASHTNITRQTSSADVNYNATAAMDWTGGVLGGVPVLNNGFDDPQMWLPSDLSTKLQKLSNWPAATQCKSLRVFKQFLIALAPTKSSIQYPHTIKWSHPAEPGTVPISWDIADPTKLAGESAKTSESSGFIVDGAVLRDTFIIYKEDSVWGMQLLTTSDVFRIFKIFSTGGILAQNCAVEYFNGKHAVFGINDIYYHDGQQMVSIIAEKVRTKIYTEIDGTNFSKAHAVHSLSSREVWFCYPTAGNTFCDRALVWNYESNTTGFRDLPNISYTTVGIIDPSTTGTDQWGLDTQNWIDDTTQWDARLFNPTQSKLLMLSPPNTKAFIANYTNSFDGTPMMVSLERNAIGMPIKSQSPPDFSTRKFIRNVWPRITGTTGETVMVEVGTHDNALDEVVWETPVPFVIGTTVKVDSMCTGRLLAVRFSSNTVMQWKVHGYELEYEPLGRF